MPIPWPRSSLRTRATGPTSAAAGMVVTEMKTPIRALARASVNETTPTIPARTATTIENKFGLSMRPETGRTPSEYNFGVCPDQRIDQGEEQGDDHSRGESGEQGEGPRITGRLVRLSMPSATPMIALYSGPTTMAPTIRIWELVRMPTAPIRPAMVEEDVETGWVNGVGADLASTISQTGATSRWTRKCSAGRAVSSPSVASTCSMATAPPWSTGKASSCRNTELADWDRTSNCTASPAGRRAVPGEHQQV